MKASLIIFFSLLSFINFSQDSIVVYFPFNSDEVSTTKLSSIKKKLLKEASSVDKIYGYTDSIGNFFYNQDLSLRRANKTLKQLSNGAEELFSKTELRGLGEKNFEGSKGRKVVIYFNQKISYQIKNAKAGENLKINNLNFEPGSEILLPGSIPILDDLLDIMLEFPKLVIAIEGHICCDPNDQTNLSGSRAKVVYDFLIQNGIRSERLSYKGFGSTKPIYHLPEQNEMQQISNRRVEIRVISKN
ncbi:MAG: OmpA family protein [Bacteroidetes bacterium]|nr:OmpA family protein [Bacteroidota bacterium]